MYCTRHSHRKKELLRHRGTLKASVLNVDPKCMDIFVLSMYNTNPIYEKIQWTNTERKLWNNEKSKKVDAPFYGLNLINEYNIGMSNVDQADQLRLQYRVHYWLRNQKW